MANRPVSPKRVSSGRSAKDGSQGLDRAISSAGGVAWDEVDERFMELDARVIELDERCIETALGHGKVAEFRGQIFN